ncbi:MAG: AraC family transcriptional regulator ligand-binding domain-containing protein [Pseudomonadota bacterium]
MPAAHSISLRPSVPFVPARYFMSMCDLVAADGHDADAILTAAGIDPELAKRPHLMLTVQQMVDFLAEMERVSGRSDLGFEVARQIKMNSHDMAGHGMLSSANLGQLVRFTSRFYQLLIPLYTMQFKRAGQVATLEFQPQMAMPQRALVVLMEMIGHATYRHLRELTEGALVSCVMNYSMDAPRHAARYRELPGATVHFSARSLPGMTLSFDAALLNLPLPMADARAHALAEERCKAMLNNVRQTSWKAWITMMLLDARDCQPKLDEFARLANVSTRTLDRYLRAEGTSFRALSLQVRTEQACSMLLDASMPVSQLAFRLGYTDVSNFNHSFKSVMGCSPTAYRKQVFGTCA